MLMATRQACSYVGQVKYIKKGKDGTSVKIDSKSVQYGISASGTDPSTVSSWSNSILNITTDKPYLWTKTYVHYTDGNSTTSYSVATRGNRGAVFRQHTAFVSGEFNYQSGVGAEEFIDVIRSGNVWYRCIKSYNSKNTPAANSLTNAIYWSTSGMTNMDFIATQLLLAQNATIDMLGANEINLYDSSNNQFGSFRVPHVNSTDGNTYALWLGGKTGEAATFSVTKAGAIKATSGKIGSFDIKTYTDSTNFKFYGLYAHTDGTPAIPASTSQLDYTGLYIGSGLSALGGSVRIGWNGSQDGAEFSWSNGLVYADGNFVNSTKTGEQVAFNADMAGNNKNTVVGFEASAYNGANNYAFYARQGDFVSQSGLFRGLRPNIRTTGQSVALTDTDNVVVCTNSSDITLTFPSSPKKGQMYIVIQTGGNIYFSGNGKTFRGRLSGGTVNSKTGGQITFFFWDGSYWSCSYAN